MKFELNKKIGLVAASVFFVLLVSLTPNLLDEITLNHQDRSLDTNASVLESDSGAENVSLGLDIGNKLNYGNMPHQANATKFLTVNSSKDTIVYVSSEGNMSNHLHYEDKHYFSGEHRIPLEFRGMKSGNFSGKIHLDIRTPSNRVGDYWIRYRGDYWPFSHVAENARDRLDLVLYRLGV